MAEWLPIDPTAPPLVLGAGAGGLVLVSVAADGAWQRVDSYDVSDVAGAALVGTRPPAVLVHASALPLLRDGLPAELPAEGARYCPWLDAPGWETDNPCELDWRVMVRPIGARTWLPLVFLPYDIADRCYPWTTVDHAADLVTELGRFGAAVGFPWQTSAGQTAERLIDSTHPRQRGGTQTARFADVPPVPIEAKPINWRRPFTDGERRPGETAYVHGFDANSQYLAAWQTVELGLGEPEYRTGPIELPASPYPGVWLVDVPPSPDQLPPVAEPGPRWVTTPTLRRLLEVHGGAAIHEAWIWPSRSRYLRGAAERLRDGRAQLLDAGGPALEAVKTLYRVGTGRLAMERPGRQASGYHRPDWAAAIRAQARANLDRTLRGSPTRPPLHVAPFAIATDGLLFLSYREPDGLAFAERIGLRVGTKLGEFSHELSAPIDADTFAELDNVQTAKRTFSTLRNALERSNAGGR